MLLGEPGNPVIARFAPVPVLIMASIIAACQSPPDRTEPAIWNEEDLVVLANGGSIEIAVSPEHGGELSGFKVNVEGTWHELVYRARDYSGQRGWRGKADVLWPATGVSIDSSGAIHHYELSGSTHRMPFHGFARHVRWREVNRLVTADSARVTLELSGNYLIQENYPFDFRVAVEYWLTSDCVRISYTVRAGSGNVQAMPFSMGNHITLNAPLLAGSEAGAVAFRHNQSHELVIDERRTFTGQVKPNPYDGWTPLTALPKRLAVSLGGADGDATLSVRDPSGFELNLSHAVDTGPAADAVKFNLWADTDDGFFSPQPWAGAQNSLNSGLGLIRLDPGQSWRWRIDIAPRIAGAPATACTS